ncbi:polyketide cyclase/dehydrase/lipid transport protein [Mycobacterium sp. BK558]|nr:polyketide cyclase/dehydrase/lipid transport protein [Mycobacterium sp. BK558]
MEWSETVTIDQPLARVRQAIADENELLAWSAWPEATGYTCRIEGDGLSVGSAIVFTDAKGTTQGRQELHSLDEHTVDYRLRNRGPGGREMTPHLRFRLEDVDGDRTRVHLDFQATAPLPPGLRHLVEAVMGRRVRRLHIKDLQQLKQHVENTTVR